MVSRDTAVHAAALAVGVVAFAVGELSGLTEGSDLAAAALVVVVYGIVLGGAHLYLALRGEDGLVPVEARWRYLGMLAILFVTTGIVLLAGDRTIAGIEVNAIGLVVVVFTIVGYVVIETRSGYRSRV